MTGVWLADTSISAFGPRDLTTLQPGQVVLTVIHEHWPSAIILGVLPPADLDPGKTIPSLLLLATRSRVDESHKLPLRMTGLAGPVNWLAGRPFDLTTGGEKGWITETGLRICIDSFLVQLAVDESCGIFAFLHDQLLRIAGQNLQLWTAGMVQEGILDGNEYNHITGITPYPWEQLGLFEPGDPRRELEAEDWQVKEPHYSKWEPKDDKQMPWHRYRQFQGYLGQGAKQSIQGPPRGAEGPNKFGTATEHPLLFDSFTGLNGYHALASAAGISIHKRIGMVSPLQKARPEQPDADTSTNYKFGGQTGDGPAPKITTEPATQDDDASLQRVAGLLDLHAYLFNYAGTHPFFWHGKDWGLAEESALEWTEGKSLHGDAFDYSKLASKMILPPPKPLRIKVDHRYGEQDYYQTESGIDFLPDGSVVIFDGWGSEIVMSGGSISSRAAGDIWHQAGRNVNTWAGYDAITRAKNSIDLSATERDVRIKAERNVQVVAGNSGSGGVLIESRATEDEFNFEKFGEDAVYQGIILRAAHSEVINWAKNVYVRTGGGDVDAGVITIDANKGQANISLHGSMINNYVSNGVFHYFGNEGDVTKANSFLEGFCTICSPTFIGGAAVVAGSLLTQGSIAVTNGHIATEQAKSASNLVGTLEGESLRQANETIADEQTIANNEIPQLGKTFFNAELQPTWYDTNRPGEDTTIRKGTFSFRDPKQYSSEDFKLYEARWQQMSRLAGQTLPTWEEKPVATLGQQFYPYPGKDAFTDDKFFQQELTLFEVKEGHSKDRGKDGELVDAYKEPKYGVPKAVSLQQYTVIRKPNGQDS